MLIFRLRDYLLWAFGPLEHRSSRSVLRPIGSVALAIVLLVSLASCGKKGPPLPPLSADEPPPALQEDAG